MNFYAALNIVLELASTPTAWLPKREASKALNADACQLQYKIYLISNLRECCGSTTMEMLQLFKKGSLTLLWALNGPLRLRKAPRSELPPPFPSSFNKDKILSYLAEESVQFTKNNELTSFCRLLVSSSAGFLSVSVLVCNDFARMIRTNMRYDLFTDAAIRCQQLIRALQNWCRRSTELFQDDSWSKLLESLIVTRNTRVAKLRCRWTSWWHTDGVWDPSTVLRSTFRSRLTCFVGLSFKDSLSISLLIWKTSTWWGQSHKIDCFSGIDGFLAYLVNLPSEPRSLSLVL